MHTRRALLGYALSFHYPSEKAQLNVLSVVMVSMGLAAFSILICGIPAVYGRYAPNCSSLWGFNMNGKLAWVVQECPNVVLGVSNIILGRPECLTSTVNQVFMAMFLVHYVNRTFIYPLQIRGGKPTPFSVRICPPYRQLC